MSTLSLAEHLARVPDGRQEQGKRHPLAALLNLVAAGVLCGMRGLSGIAQFGRLPRGCWNWCAATGASRTACTMSAT